MAANLSSADEARLRAAIWERGLQVAEELIVSFAVECATLCTLGPEDYAQTGTSRYGGVPDLPDETWWPQTADGKFYNFYIQINLADMPDFVGNVLPRRGMLYCFMARRTNAAIIWADVEPSALKRADEKAESELTGWDNGILKPHQMEIRTAINPPGWCSGQYDKIQHALEEKFDILDGPAENYDAQFVGEMLFGSDGWCANNENRSAGRLLGQPEYFGRDSNDYRDGLVHDTLLLRLDTNEAVGVEYSDEGYIQIFIGRDALEKHDFSDTVAQMEPPYKYTTEGL